MARQVYVGNLPFSVTWGELKDLVREIAGVTPERADVVTNQMGKSRGYGTVLFSTPAEAQRAIDVLNDYEYQGRLLQVREDRNAGLGGGSPFSNGGGGGGLPSDSASMQQRTLYVGNLPYSVQWQDLKDLIRQAGNIVRADIPTDYQGRSKGYGVVTMATIEDARNAISMFSGYEWSGRRLEVREDRSMQDEGGYGGGGGAGGGGGSFSGSQSGSGGPAAAGTQLYIGNLPYSFSWQNVKDMVRQAGQVLRADVVTDGVRSKGYATVVMVSPEAAQKAIEMLNGAEVQGRVIEVREDRLAGGGQKGIGSPLPGAAGIGGVQSGSGTAIFVSNLPFTTRWQDLKDIFRPHNLLPTHADVMVDSSGRSKGLGTVRFTTREDAERAVEVANGLTIGGRQIAARLDRFL
ncbi:hypothetical protein DFJ74DRAFT_669601 [Hyaloraphidium curvatum]|nr:hypothetical protein DFJ74DRAFT_669601 [Hyaloraphidium curvatum]